MNILKILLWKDLKNAGFAIWPALLLGVPLLLILQFTAGESSLSFRTALWVSYFFSSVSLLYRSYGQEFRSRNFQIYSAFQISKLAIFTSQALVHAASLCLVGLVYFGLSILFWNPIDIHWSACLTAILLVSLCLAPLGTCLGLMLQLEREFLFSLFFLPFASPLVLGAYELSGDQGELWGGLLLAFFLIGSFLSAAFFEFFFDELSQTH